MMTEKEAIQAINNRIGELKSNPQVQAELMQKHKAGMTKTMCKKWLADVAIATLCGNSV
jgi:hypothetical protein